MDRSKPTLRRETLRDLSPDGAEAAAVRGGTLPPSLPPLCPFLGGGGNGTSGTITGADCSPGTYIFDQRHWIEVEVLPDLDIRVRRVHSQVGDAQSSEGVDFNDVIRGDGPAE